MDDSNYYVKCFLSNGYVLADDMSANAFLLVKETKTLFTEPFSEEIEFDGKKFKFLYSAHAVAEKTAGEEIFKKGASEKFWDYKADDDNTVETHCNASLRQLSPNTVLDLCGTIVKTSGVNLK
ncbi:hypothetical protein A2477_02355 [Candidatus Falkowbacteria bacterium RIFOXYC2_FULL_47_12]|uniref:Uncharacterized protein n=2 Tax=Candidatus Falkowiibacteriota TaxID=1752728 RepID=A0A1F5TMF6_9BACT|nr:MAG: hypothetical protein A2242_00645 [Candidatus Falkowbacteria bacterium RIFOXYA2_FULL_47_9]OGF40135.1 MAG: hypothetical protein A2477_02355 [Candidatus Falkowbacteria bacterium RIFOXYC2_FULL_47_12]